MLKRWQDLESQLEQSTCNEKDMAERARSQQEEMDSLVATLNQELSCKNGRIVSLESTCAAQSNQVAAMESKLLQLQEELNCLRSEAQQPSVTLGCVVTSNGFQQEAIQMQMKLSNLQELLQERETRLRHAAVRFFSQAMQPGIHLCVVLQRLNQ